MLDVLRKENEGLATSLNDLKNLTQLLLKRIDALETKNAMVEAKYKQLEERIKNSGTTDEICMETTLRHQKRKFLVISGIKENSSGSADERRKSDEESISEILNSLDIRNATFSQTTRIGRPNADRSRLLRFKCPNITMKKEILTKSKNLRSFPKFSEIFISPDLTKLQITKSKELRDQLRRRRDAGEDVIILRNQIVTRDSSAHFKKGF